MVRAAAAVTAVRFGRVTTATAATLAPTDDHATWTVAVAPSVVVARRLTPGAWLEVELGASVLTTVPVFGVTGPSGFAEVGRPWRIEPTLAARVVVGAR